MDVCKHVCMCVYVCFHVGLLPSEMFLIPAGRYVWPDGFAVFNWETFGNVEETRCKLDGGDELPCKF